MRDLSDVIRMNDPVPCKACDGTGHYIHAFNQPLWSDDTAAKVTFVSTSSAQPYVIHCRICHGTGYVERPKE